jgi:hypothetical protein
MFDTPLDFLLSATPLDFLLSATPLCFFISATLTNFCSAILLTFGSRALDLLGSSPCLLGFLNSAKLDSFISLFGAVKGDTASKFALTPLVAAVLPLLVSGSLTLTNICCEPEMLIR